jgi:hypothetical protein
MALFIGLTAVAMFAIGTWGARNATELIPSVLSEEERAKRARVYKRGARVLQFTAVLFLASLLAAVASRLLAG